MINVFLSASVPLPSRHRRFYETAEVLGIRESVKALVEVVLPVGRITSGGHPAITPLIALFVREGDLPKDRLTIFQSRYFVDRFPQENEEFADVRVMEEVPDNMEASLAYMRHEMLRSQDFDVAVLIGGMEGVLEEARMFAELHPRAPIIPVASTGAAARLVFEGGNFPPDYATQLTYQTLFRHHIRPAQ
jgi:hypothetical protein